jgi:hypothetical protein
MWLDLLANHHEHNRVRGLTALALRVIDKFVRAVGGNDFPTLSKSLVCEPLHPSGADELADIWSALYLLKVLSHEIKVLLTDSKDHQPEIFWLQAVRAALESG